MTPAEFKQARHKLGLTVAALGKILDTAPQTIRKWEMEPDRCSTARRVNPVAAKVMRWMLSNGRPDEWPGG